MKKYNEENDKQNYNGETKLRIQVL